MILPMWDDSKNDLVWASVTFGETSETDYYEFLDRLDARESTDVELIKPFLLAARSATRTQPTETMKMVIVESRPSGNAFEYDNRCFYARDSKGMTYRILWSDFTGLKEKDRIIVEYYKIVELTYDSYPDGGWTPKYEMTVKSVVVDNSEDTTNGYVYDTTPRSIPFTPYFLSFGECSMFSEENSVFEGNPIQPIVIDSFEKLQQFYRSLAHLDDYTISFFENIPEDYFDQKLLLVNNFTFGGTPNDRHVEYVHVDENGVKIKYTYAYPDLQSEVVDNCIVAIEINRSDVYGHIIFTAVAKRLPYNYNVVYGGEVSAYSYDSKTTYDILPQEAEMIINLLNDGEWMPGSTNLWPKYTILVGEYLILFFPQEKCIEDAYCSSTMYLTEEQTQALSSALFDED